MKNSSSQFNRLLAIAAFFSVLVSQVFAVSPFTIKDIRIEGLQRVEVGTVFATLPFRVGETYNDDKAALSVRSLFALGMFKDVRVEVVDDVVVIIVQERPTINGLEFSGAKEFDKETLTRMFKDLGLLEGRAFDKALADKAEQEIKRQYLSRSYFGTKIVTTATPIDRNRVNLTVVISEGEVAKIKHIRFSGNNAFSDDVLRGELNLDAGNWFSWYTKSNRYSKAKLNADVEALRAFYLANGYIEFKVDPPKVDVSTNQEEIEITINVNEGPRYLVSAVKLDGNYLGKDREFQSQVTVEVGKSYKADQARETSQNFTKIFGNFGYAFARVDTVPVLDRANGLVTLVYKSDPGLRAYVRRINISGNNKTRDEVIRREFRQMEASWFDGEKIRTSRDRVDRLGFFTEVQIETQEVQGAPDQVDINLQVVEKPTGNYSLGAGYSSSDKLTFQAGLKQENVLGSGQYLGLNLNTGKLNRQIAVTNVDPYFTTEGISRTIEVFNRTTNPSTLLDTDYRLVNRGLGLRFGIPFSDDDTVYFGATYDRLSVVDGTNLPDSYRAYINKVGTNSYTVPLSVGWARDTRDSAVVPNSGSYQRLNLEANYLGDSKYLKATAQYQKYVPLNRKWTLAMNSQLDWGKGLGGNSFPFFKTVTGGGLGSVRGFETNTLGPYDKASDSYLGGSKAITLNAEVLTPFPGTGNDKTLRLYGFLDVGNVFGESDSVKISALRSSVGVGLSWISPLGPLRLSYAKPLKTKDADKLEKIQFQIGASF